MEKQADQEFNVKRKIREGIVVSNKMQKTIKVRVNRTFKHPDFNKVITRGKIYYAHVEEGVIEIGKLVKIIETRPLSKLKRWRVLQVL
ncbi:30S ribosomal protein S17 [Candidatus Rhabdochlamydia sp. T3358]|uniref:30S ribosomal protein S17 n=1 Tax=Candidatus Rhabdochlamydia sp. T3358 TaxID=2099795 RepID=UPI0010B4DAD1|nr:30S ribosomal protein S17 [Candidatus Rhabdochlamydia sp. T3358]VHO04641.1 30S ribosomal protein S17 [Candidatus Rhabdochlamydia sp. T3358]